MPPELRSFRAYFQSEQVAFEVQAFGLRGAFGPRAAAFRLEENQLQGVDDVLGFENQRRIKRAEGKAWGHFSVTKGRLCVVFLKP